MSKQPTSFRLGEMTRQQLDALVKVTGMNRVETISLAIDRMYREEFDVSKIALRAGIMPDDSKTMMADKLRIWIDTAMPEATGAQKVDQALLAWNAIHAVWGRSSKGFAESWGAGASAALKRQDERFELTF